MLHAVAVDGLYDTAPERVATVIADSLLRASQLSAQTVALTALATGYGRKSIEFFVRALAIVVDQDFPPVERVVIGLKRQSDVDELRAMLPRLEMT